MRKWYRKEVIGGPLPPFPKRRRNFNSEKLKLLGRRAFFHMGLKVIMVINGGIIYGEKSSYCRNIFVERTELFMITFKVKIFQFYVISVKRTYENCSLANFLTAKLGKTTKT